MRLISRLPKRMIVQKNLSPDSKGRKSCISITVQVAVLLFLVYSVAAVFIIPSWRSKTSDLVKNESVVSEDLSAQSIVTDKCKDPYRARGSEPIPKGIVNDVSNLEMRPLWGKPKERPSSMNLLALSVGIKQKRLVNEMVKKFLATSDFVVMLFHYDGNVDAWKTFEWSDKVIHISAASQTKWWFAKRFLHPDILVDYEYIFLWDEDLGVDSFDPKRYLSIVKQEELHISQPALGKSSEVHHQITARVRNRKVHRQIYKNGTCYSNSTGPPCAGWIEVMAPVFSKSSWRCVWHMIQNDLIHAWGLDMHLGYCAQGDRTKHVGVVDSEYVVHHGLPTLGEPRTKAPPKTHVVDKRIEVRRQSYNEYKTFTRRWKEAIAKDECWKDPYSEPIKSPF